MRKRNHRNRCPVCDKPIADTARTCVQHRTKTRSRAWVLTDKGHAAVDAMERDGK